MPTVLLIRHGRSAANATAILAGRTPGVLLDDTGRRQATDLAARLSAVPLATVVSSPLERCVSTAEAILAGREPLALRLDERLIECDYGDWTNKELKVLVKEPEWKAVQSHPSSVQFPGGETMRAMQARAVDAVRDWERRVAEEHGPDSVWVAVSHADVIKSVLADALGAHLDEFQRIVVDPASVSVIRFTQLRPFVMRVNDNGGSFADLIPSKPKRGRRAAKAASSVASSDAMVGGSTGAATATT